MHKEILTFGDIEIEKNKFYSNKIPIFLDIEKVLVSSNISFGEKYYKYFIDYFYNNYKVKPLHIMLPKTSTYIKSYDGRTKWVYFFIEDDGLLEKYNTIWDKVSDDIKKNLIVNLSIIKTFLKPK